MIAIDNITLIYDKNIVIEDYSLFVKKGERVVLTGPSGVGKSSLLNCIAGFVLPFNGNISIDNITLSSNNVDQVRQKLAYLPQETHLDLFTAADYFYYPYTFKHNRSLRPSLDTAKQVLVRLNLSQDILKQRVNELSGGQKQRLAFAAILLLNRPIMLLDEPTAALDDTSTAAVIELLKERQTTLLSVSHDQRWISCMDRNIRLTLNKK